MKKYDVSAKVDTYETRTGEKKGVWRNVGSIHVNNDGGLYMFLDRTFNPAGMPGDRHSVILSLFEPKERDSRDGGSSDDPSSRIPF